MILSDLLAWQSSFIALNRIRPFRFTSLDSEVWCVTKRRWHLSPHTGSPTLNRRWSGSVTSSATGLLPQQQHPPISCMYLLYRTKRRRCISALNRLYNRGLWFSDSVTYLPCDSATLLLYDSVTLWLCYTVTVLFSYSVGLSLCDSVTVNLLLYDCGRTLVYMMACKNTFHFKKKS